MEGLGETPASPPAPPASPWAPGGAVAFTDGACRANGAAGARAGFAAVVRWGGGGCARVSGPVPARELALADPDRGAPLAAGAPAPPTNNRAEMLAIIYALLAVRRAGVRGPVLVVTDSRLCVGTLDEWLPRRRRLGTAAELHNLDLAAAAERLLADQRARGPVELRHVRGHQRRPPADAPALERCLWAGNDAADRLARAAVDADGVSVAGAPPAGAEAALVGLADDGEANNA